MRKKIGSALIVGAGISGIRSALDLAEMGYRVTLIDKAPNLGGTLTQLDYQFPSDHCGMCKMLPLVERDRSSQYCLRKGLFHENIEILLSTELTALKGDPGRFLATLRQKPTMVDPERCIGCGECSRVCPVEVPDEFNAGLTKRKGVYLPVPHNIPNHYVVDMTSCTLCGECEKVCPTTAIDFGVSERSAERQIEVGAVILAAGFASFDPATGKNTYGYGVLGNVVTSIEFERMVSGTGPSRGRLLRPSDGKEIRNVAWLQCIGSRDPQANADFCSSICCMYAIKEALLAKGHSGNQTETTIFYMDMRTFGKNFQRYRDQAEKEHGVVFQRCRVHSVEPAGSDGDLLIRYVDVAGIEHEEVFDLVVLATGQRPPPGTEALAETTGVHLNKWGFCQLQSFSLSRTTQEGVAVGGSFSGLRDISESVIQASSAALTASGLIHAKGGSLAEVSGPKPEFRDVSRELPQVFVALCTCGGAFADATDIEATEKSLTNLTSMTQVSRIERICTQDGWNELQETLRATDANRILIGACVPHVYAKKLRELGEDVGLNPALIDVVDIRTAAFPGRDVGREQVAREIRAAIAMSVAKLRDADPLPLATTRIVQKALVVGGGIAGMTAALAIADHGFEVTLVEQAEQLGGNLRLLHRTLEGDSPQELLEKTVPTVEEHPHIHVYLKTRVIHSHGRVGHFVTTFEKEDGGGETLEHGVVVLATGAHEARTESYGYGKSEAIVTQHELEEKLEDGTLDTANLNVVTMIQCVESREEPRNYCSRICCASALKNALYLKEKNPEIEVYVFFRDVMAYGFLETYYTKARRAGVIFFQYDVQEKPRVSVETGQPVISAVDPIIGREITVKPDLLVLSTGIVPGEQRKLADVFGVEVDQDGFFQEAESKWRPVDFIKEGIFMCGIAHSPRSITESIAMAEAAAQRALRILSSEHLAGGGIVAEVRHSLCSLCQQCVTACPYGARWYDEDQDNIVVDALTCQGCGSCTTVCPNSASVLRGYRDQQMFEVIDAALEEMF
jgi:heterodisulfide reductase subunit A